MQDKDDSSNRLPSSRNDYSLLLISNVILAVATVAILWWSADYFRQNTAVQTARASRFLTMEWNLLQELKEQTDKQLMEKDREIAALRQQYNQLIARGGTNADLSVLEEQLAAAEAERDIIVRDRIEIAQPPSASQARRPTGEESSVVAERLQAEVDQLHRELQELRERATDRLAALERYENAVSSSSTGSVSTVPELPTMEMINIRNRLRAVLSLPDVRREYPELMTNLDRYMETLESRARQNGEESTLEEASAEIESIAEALDISLPVETLDPPGTDQGYRQRLLNLVHAAARTGDPYSSVTNTNAVTVEDR
jgi:hypothetical protein